MLLLLLGIGFASGFISGLLGLGGGSIRIPLLNLIGFPLIFAYGMNFFTIPVSCSMGAYTQRENFDSTFGSSMAIGGSIGMLMGTAVTFWLSASALSMAIMFVVVSILAVVGMNLNHIAPHLSNELSPSRRVVALATFGANTLAAMKGGSGASLYGPLLKTFKVNIHRAIATSLFVATITSTIGVFLYWSQGQLLLIEGLAVLVGSLLGSRVGSLLSLDTESKWLEVGLSVAVVALASITLLKALFA
ncbi:MAG: TSUP family transporter [Candidatus Lokiarchaeota archaeon]|nr:TSUP family transporter [Candidatus Lokiarchaeota archaeon]